MGRVLTRVRQMRDVDTFGAGQDGAALVWDNAQLKFVPGSAGGTPFLISRGGGSITAGVDGILDVVGTIRGYGFWSILGDGTATFNVATAQQLYAQTGLLVNDPDADVWKSISISGGNFLFDAPLSGTFVGNGAAVTGVNAAQLQGHTVGTGAGNIPVLDGSGLLATSTLPPLAITQASVVASQAAMLALAAQRGDVAIRTDTGKSYILSTDSPGTLADWVEIRAAGAVTSVNGQTGNAVIGMADISGLVASLDGKLAIASNLSDLADKSTSRKNLGATAFVSNIAGLSALPAVNGQVARAAGYFTAGDGGGGDFIYDSGSAAAIDGGLVVAAVGGVGRWLRVWSGVADVRWWGAMPDSTNRATEIQAALSSSASHINFPYVVGGIYLTREILIIPSNKTLLSNGATLKLDPTLSALSGGGNRVMLRNTTYFGTDHDITIIGLFFDGANLNGGGPSGGASGAIGNSPLFGGKGLGAAISMGGVSRVRISNCRFTNCYMSAIQIASCDDWILEDISLDSMPLDGIHVNGPSSKGIIRNIWGSTDDDFIALQAEDWLYGSPNYGPLADILVENLNCETTATYLVKISVGGASPAKRITMRNLRQGSGGLATIRIAKDTDPDGTHVITEGSAEDITIDGLRTDSAGGRYLFIDATLEKLTIRDWQFDGATDAATVGVYFAPTSVFDNVEIINVLMGDTSNVLGALVEVDGTAAAGRIAIRGGQFAERNVVSFAPIVLAQNGAVINSVILDGLNVLAPVGFAVQVDAGARIKDLDVSGCQFIASASSATLFQIDGQLDRMRVTGGRFSGGGDSFFRNGAAASPVTVTLNGVDFEGFTHAFWNQGGTINIVQSGCTYTNLAADIVVHYPNASARTNVFSANCRLVGTGVVFVNSAAGSQIRYSGSDIAQDLSLLTPVKWDLAKSTNAAIGVAIWDAVAWRAFDLASFANASNLTSGTVAPARMAITESRPIVFDGGGSVVTVAGSEVEFTVPYACTITGWTLLADAAGNLTVEVEKATYAGYPTTANIAASAKPTLTAQQKNSDNTLTGWATAVAAGDVLKFYLSGTPATIKKATLTLNLLRT